MTCYLYDLRDDSRRLWSWQSFFPRCLLTTRRARLQNVSKIFRGSGLIQEPDHALDRNWTEMHVTLRRRETRVPASS
jgi:hypothetical protein